MRTRLFCVPLNFYGRRREGHTGTCHPEEAYRGNLWRCWREGRICWKLKRKGMEWKGRMEGMEWMEWKMEWKDGMELVWWSCLFTKVRKASKTWALPPIRSNKNCNNRKIFPVKLRRPWYSRKRGLEVCRIWTQRHSGTYCHWWARSGLWHRWSCAKRDTLSKEVGENWGGRDLYTKLAGRNTGNLYKRALERRDAMTVKVDTYDEFKRSLTKLGFVLAHWDGTPETEEKIKEETKPTHTLYPAK